MYRHSSVPDHGTKVSHHNKESCDLFASRGPGLQFPKSSTSVKYNKVKDNKTRCLVLKSMCLYSVSIHNGTCTCARVAFS